MRKSRFTEQQIAFALKPQEVANYRTFSAPMPPFNMIVRESGVDGA